MSLAVNPYGPVILSTSTDCTLRVWSLETCDEVDQYVSVLLLIMLLNYLSLLVILQEFWKSKIASDLIMNKFVMF